MSFKSLLASALMLVALFTMPVWAAPKASTITISDAWAPPSLSQAAGVAYLTIKNNGAADSLLRVEATAVTTQPELHTHTHTAEGVVQMRKLNALELPAKSTVTMQPGGHHIMLIGLQKPLIDGADFELTCYFTTHAPITIRVKIDKARLLAHIKSRNTHPQH